MLVVIYKCTRAFINPCNQYVAFWIDIQFWHTWHPILCGLISPFLQNKWGVHVLTKVSNHKIYTAWSWSWATEVYPYYIITCATLVSYMCVFVCVCVWGGIREAIWEHLYVGYVFYEHTLTNGSVLVSCLRSYYVSSGGGLWTTYD